MLSDFAGQFLNLRICHGLCRVQLCDHLLIGYAVRQHNAYDGRNTSYASNDNFYHLVVTSALTDFAISLAGAEMGMMNCLRRHIHPLSTDSAGRRPAG